MLSLSFLVTISSFSSVEPPASLEELLFGEYGLLLFLGGDGDAVLAAAVASLVLRFSVVVIERESPCNFEMEAQVVASSPSRRRLSVGAFVADEEREARGRGEEEVNDDDDDDKEEEGGGGEEEEEGYSSSSPFSGKKPVPACRGLGEG